MYETMRDMTVTSRPRPKGRVPKQKSKSVSEPVDPRVEKTRAALTGAFVALVSRRAYDRIRVSDITRKAGIGRATFYAHFSSKDYLLRSELARIVLPMMVELPDEPCLVDCAMLFGHVQHARDIYRSLTAGHSRSVTERIVQEAFEARVADIVSERAARGGIGAKIPAFAPRFVASTVLTLIAWSLEQAVAPTPVELQKTFRALVGGALGTGRHV
jgi:AcrR family transcriptional regulator